MAWDISGDCYPTLWLFTREPGMPAPDTLLAELCVMMARELEANGCFDAATEHRKRALDIVGRDYVRHIESLGHAR